MYSTTIYLYQQIIRVLLIDTSGGYFTARYDPVYAKTLTVNKGVDNVLSFQFLNQEQKPVDISWPSSHQMMQPFSSLPFSGVGSVANSVRGCKACIAPGHPTLPPTPTFQKSRSQWRRPVLRVRRRCLRVRGAERAMWVPWAVAVLEPGR